MESKINYSLDIGRFRLKFRTIPDYCAHLKANQVNASWLEIESFSNAPDKHFLTLTSIMPQGCYLVECSMPIDGGDDAIARARDSARQQVKALGITVTPGVWKRL